MKAVAYLRISTDEEGDERGVLRQREDAHKLAKSLGWTLDQIVDENDVSAYRKRLVTLPDGRRVRRVVRPKFDGVLEGLRDGTWQGFIVNHVDRLAREPRDLEEVIEQVEDNGVVVREFAGPGITPGDDASVQMARMRVIMANQSSRDTSRRIKRSMQSLVEKGLPNGGARPFGYCKTPPERPGGPAYFTTLVPEETAIIREIVERILRGESRTTIARDLTERSVPNTNGASRWTVNHLSRIIKNPRYAGLRSHNKIIIGKGAWPAIITPEERERLLAIASAHVGATRVGKARSRLLGARLLTCGLCGAGMSSRLNTNGDPCYACANGGHLARSCKLVDEVVAAHVVEVLRRPDAASFFTADGEGERAPLRAEVELLRGRLESLAAEFGADPTVSASEFRSMRQPTVEKLQKAESRLRELGSVTPHLDDLLDGRDPAEAWTGWDHQQRRLVIQSIFESITVMPQGRVGKASHPELIVFAPKEIA